MEKLKIPALPEVKTRAIKVFIKGQPYCQVKVRGSTAGPAKWTEAVKKATRKLPKIRGQCHLWVMFVLPANKYPTDHPYGPDLDNLLKRLLDAMHETVFSEVPGKDGAVALLVATKRRALGDEPTGARVTLREIKADDEAQGLLGEKAKKTQQCPHCGNSLTD